MILLDNFSQSIRMCFCKRSVGSESLKKAEIGDLAKFYSRCEHLR